jgi:signal transduction histidine kinase
MPVIYISNLKWEFARRAEYISLYLAVPAAALFSYHLFPREFSRKVLYIILGVSSIFVTLSLFAPYYFYTFPLKYYEAVVLLTVFYGLYVYIRAALKKRPGSFLFLAGFCIFLVTIINDLLYENLIIDTMWMFYIGLASFCIILSILLSRQFVQIFYDLQIANKKLSVANTELDTMNNQIKEKNEELKEINYELDKFVNRTSHDLKAPLISVLKIIDAAEDEKDVGKLHTYFLMQKKTLNRVSNLVKDIINYSKNKRHPLDLREIDFTELVDRVLEDHAITLSAENIKKKVQINQYEKFVSDVRCIRVIISNLISNAAKYADATKSNQQITIEVSVANNMATIDVSENGIGMEEKNLNEIFSLFYTTTSNITGSDLGLYIIKDTVEKLNGYITINSKKGHGTNIKVMIPDMGHKM